MSSVYDIGVLFVTICECENSRDKHPKDTNRAPLQVWRNYRSRTPNIKHKHEVAVQCHVNPSTFQSFSERLLRVFGGVGEGGSYKSLRAFSFVNVRLL